MSYNKELQYSIQEDLQQINTKNENNGENKQSKWTASGITM